MRKDTLNKVVAKMAARPKADASTNARNLAQAQKANAGTQRAFFGTNMSKVNGQVGNAPKQAISQRMREQQVAAQKAAQGANRFTAAQKAALSQSASRRQAQPGAMQTTAMPKSRAQKATVLSPSKGPNPKPTAAEMQAVKALEARTKALQARAQAKPKAGTKEDVSKALQARAKADVAAGKPTPKRPFSFKRLLAIRAKK